MEIESGGGTRESASIGQPGRRRSATVDRVVIAIAIIAVAAATAYATWRALAAPADDDIAPADTGDVVTLAKGGSEVDLVANLVPGKYTIYDFYADWCPPCRALDVELRGMASRRADLAIRRIDIVDWTTPVVKQHGFESLPFIVLFGPDGQEISRGDRALFDVMERFAETPR